MKPKFDKVSLYYDGACYLCNMEMDIYRKKDPEGILDLVDISQPHFDASALGLSEKEVNRHFHARDLDGTWYKGVDAFIVIWKTLGIYRPLSYMASSSFSRPLFLAGYEVFARVRPHLPGRKKCASDNCQI